MCLTLCDPIDGSPPGFPSLGFSRQQHWSGLPFPSPVHESEKWKWSRSVVSDSSRPHGLQPTRLIHPWDFPGKSTGVGCHCLLQFSNLISLQMVHLGNFVLTESVPCLSRVTDLYMIFNVLCHAFYPVLGGCAGQTMSSRLRLLRFHLINSEGINLSPRSLNTIHSKSQ